MEDIGDYLYIILVAVAAIGGLLKNKNKNNTPKPATETETEEETVEAYDYESFPEEVLSPMPDTRPKTTFDRQFTEMTKTPHDTIISFENTTDFSKLKAKKEVTKTVSSKAKAEKQGVSEENFTYSIRTVEEARAAFISSEIFNRKY